MALVLHNTLTRSKEPFAPIDPQNVRMYVCGPTVYDYAHIGNARPVVAFDVLFRLLRRLYGEAHVTYVRNITDVDDKIMERAAASGESIASITARTTDAYHEDMGALGALAPTREPRATEHIAPMIALTEMLIQRGHAYVDDAGSSVLFNVPSMADYGALSRRNRDDQIAGARVEVASNKRDPADFVLWKPSTPDQVGWDSPWGRGRPGWHIECSAMSWQHLGVEFDIHGGGIDLVFPHHENEIAQSRCAHGSAAMARTWLHNGFVMVGGQKMSKSLGNFLTVHDLRAKHPGEAIRLALLSGHYRQPIDITENLLAECRGTLDRWYGALRDVAAEGQPVPENEAPDPAVLAALEDDLNTPQAIAALHALVADFYRSEHLPRRAQLAARLRISAALCGFLEAAPEAWFGWAPAGAETLDAAAIESAIAARAEAKKARDFSRADAIREELKAQGVVLEDGAQGTVWRRIS